MAQDSKSLLARLPDLVKKRMKMKPTRFTGWAGKNLAASLPTRRRRSTTTHGTDGGREKHIVRIEAPTATVKRSGPRKVPSPGIVRRIFCIASGWRASSIFNLCTEIRDTGIRVFGDIHGQTDAAAGYGAVGRFFFQAAGGKFSGDIF